MQQAKCVLAILLVCVGFQALAAKFTFIVAGPSRSGKSTFLKYLNPNAPGVEVSDGMTSCTKLVETVNWENCQFLSGPGFNDTNKTSVEVFCQLMDSVMPPYVSEKSKFAGLFYFQSLCTDIIGGSDMLTQQLISAFCGKKVPIVVVFTKGDTLIENSKQKIREMKDCFTKNLPTCSFLEAKNYTDEGYAELMRYLSHRNETWNNNLLFHDEWFELKSTKGTSAFRVFAEYIKREAEAMMKVGIRGAVIDRILEQEKQAQQWTTAIDDNGDPGAAESDLKNLDSRLRGNDSCETNIVDGLYLIVEDIFWGVSAIALIALPLITV